MDRRKRSARQRSNIFKSFTQAQMMELKDIFNLIDVTSDGCITYEDLKEFMESMQSPLTEEEMKEMMEDMGGSFNLTVFLTALSERMSNLDSENVVIKALEVFDEEGSGFVELGVLRSALMEQGEGVDKEAVEVLMKDVRVIDGRVSISEVARTIKNCGMVVNSAYGSCGV